MYRILRCAIVLLIAYSTMVNFRVLVRAVSTVAESFEAHGVVPDVVSIAPAASVTVTYPSGVEVNEGNELTPIQVKDIPEVTWDASSDEYYTLAMIDAGASSSEEPKPIQVQHWLVGNILDNQVSAGETLFAYIGSGPLPDTGLHRYVFLVYKQPGNLTFDEPRIPNTSSDNRQGFSISNFTQKYNLGDPIAGNFYLAKYDDNYVPLLYAQLGLKLSCQFISLVV